MTGNVVLLGIALVTGDFHQALRHITPLVAYSESSDPFRSWLVTTQNWVETSPNDRATVRSDMNFLTKSKQIRTLYTTLMLGWATVAVQTPGQQMRPVAVAPDLSRQNAAITPKFYSTFDSVGTTSISCEGAVDWDSLFKGQIDSSFREQVLPVLKGTRFLVTLERNGTVKVATRATVAPANQEAETRANSSIQSFGGVIATVLQGWARFAVAANLPEAAETHRLDKAGDHYLVGFREGQTDVAVSMDRAFILSDERIDTADGSMQIAPKFAATLGGYLITGWNIAFPRGRGRNLSVDARYMQVQGVEVPAEMTLHSNLPSFGEITLSLALTNYQF